MLLCYAVARMYAIMCLIHGLDCRIGVGQGFHQSVKDIDIFE